MTGLLVSASAVEAQTKLSVSGQKRSIACGSGETVQVTGQGNTLTVTGDCRKVDITGANNTVAIEAVGSIEVTGTNNEITWQRALNGSDPRVSTNGAGNTIARAATPTAAADRVSAAPVGPAADDPAPPRSAAPPKAPAAKAPAASARRAAPPTTSSAAAVKVLEDGRTDAIDCNGREVSILGSRNHLELRGVCPIVIISGSDNTIDIDAAQRIQTTGDRNKVTWVEVTTGQEPRVQNTGTQNRINKADRKPESR